MSIYIYLLIFVIIISNIMNKNKNNKFMLILLSIIFIFTLSFFAGIRSVSLGYDASKYVVSVFYRLSNTIGLKDFLEITTVETGYSIFSYLLYKIYQSPHFLMFGYSFLTSLFMVLFAINEKDDLPISMTLIIYYLTIYIHSFNIIRQSIVIPMFLFVFSLIRHRQSKFLIIIVLFLAIFMHDSAILGLPIFALYYIFSVKNNKNQRSVFSLLLIIAILGLTIFYEPFIRLLYSFGLVNSKYIGYLNDASNNIDLNFADNIIRFVYLLIAILIYTRDKNESHKRMNRTLLFSMIITVAISIISIKIYPIYRCGLYYFYLSLFYLSPRVKELFKDSKTFVNLLVYSFIIFSFVWKIFIGDTYNIYPYISDVFSWIK